MWLKGIHFVKQSKHNTNKKDKSIVGLFYLLFFSCKTIIRLQERRKSTAATALSNLRRDSQIPVPVTVPVPVPPVVETAQSLAGETIAESVEDEEENKVTVGVDDGELGIPDLPELSKSTSLKYQVFNGRQWHKI